MIGVYISIFFLSIINTSEGFLFIRNNQRANIQTYQYDDWGVTEPYSESQSEEASSATSRRIALKKMITVVPVTAITASPSLAAADGIVTTGITVADATTDDSQIRVPLEYIPALSAYVVHYYLFGERFGAIVDTGSPFLTAPSTCSKWSYKYLWGCYKPELTSDSGYADTYVALDNNLGTVKWRKAGFSFDGTDIMQQPKDLVFGVFGPDLLDGPGGVFFGLIKETDKRIYPSFLGQTGYDSFCVDLRQSNTTTTSSSPQLVLSKKPLIQDDDYITLTRDLNRRYKASVVHYTAKATKFVVNGLPLKMNDKKPTYVIFDSGCTGMTVSDELFDGRYLQARKNKEKSLWGHVTITFETHAGNEVQLTATKPLTTPLDNKTLSKYKGNIIVVGLAFLDGLAMTIDTKEGKLQFSK